VSVFANAFAQEWGAAHERGPAEVRHPGLAARAEPSLPGPGRLARPGDTAAPRCGTVGGAAGRGRELPLCAVRRALRGRAALGAAPAYAAGMARCRRVPGRR